MPKQKRPFQVEIEAKVTVLAFDEESARKKVERARPLAATWAPTWKEPAWSGRTQPRQRQPAMSRRQSGALLTAHKPSSIPWSTPRSRVGAGGRASISDMWTATSQSRAWQASNGRSRSWSGATDHSSR